MQLAMITLITCFKYGFCMKPTVMQLDGKCNVNLKIKKKTIIYFHRLQKQKQKMYILKICTFRFYKTDAAMLLNPFI